VIGPDDPAALGTVHSRRAVLEGAADGRDDRDGGFAWFSAVGPPSEDERDAEDDELEDPQDDLEDRLEDDDDSGPGGGGQS
jgi:hypothetical protein